MAGNLYELQELSGIRLIDLELPPAFAERYPGPGFGVDGTRKLVQIYERPLIGTIVKPSIGLSTSDLQSVVRDLAIAGLDFIKDDELHADPPYAPLAERVPAVMAEIERVADQTGKKTMYAFNITGDLAESSASAMSTTRRSSRVRATAFASVHPVGSVPSDP